MNLSIFHLLLLCLLLSTCQLAKTQDSLDISNIEIYYVPQITRTEISIDTTYLVDTSNVLISYVCENDTSLIREFSLVNSKKNWVKARFQEWKEPFAILKIHYNNGQTQTITKARLPLFTHKKVNYYNLELYKWMRDKLPKASYPSGHRIHCY